MCTDSGVTIWDGLPVPDGLHRPGRSIILQSPANTVAVYAWGLPGEPAGNVRTWHGLVRSLVALDDLLGPSRNSPKN